MPPIFLKKAAAPRMAHCSPFFVDFAPKKGYNGGMRIQRLDDDLKQKMWHECSLLCQFLSENHAGLSQDTRLELSRRVLLLMEKAIGQDTIPDPF